MHTTYDSLGYLWPLRPPSRSLKTDKGQRDIEDSTILLDLKTCRYTRTDYEKIFRRDGFIKL